MSVTAGLRKLWLNVHLWLGVGLFLPLALIGITGTLLVWHEPLERQIFPHRYAVSDGPAVPLAVDLAAGRVALGDDFVVTAVRPPEHAGDPVVVQARAKGRTAPGERPQTRSAWVDPATGRVLDVANPRDGVLGVSHILHGSLMVQGVGRQIVGWLGVAMTISALTGIWLWWPRGALWKGLRWRRGPRTTYNLHHLTGFWLSIPLAVLALTGAYISFPQTSRSVTAMFMETRAPEGQGARGAGGGPGGGGGGQPLSQTHTDIDAVAGAIVAVAPAGAQIVSLTLPTRSRGNDGPPPSWRAQVQAPGAEAMTTVTVDDQSGEARVRGERGGAPSAGENFARLMRRVHDGGDMPLLWQIIIAIAGLAPAALGITGTVMWLRRDTAKRALKPGAEVLQAAE